MNKFYLAFALAFLLILPMISAAEQQTLGTFKQNTCINLIQTCSNCTYVNISSVNYPNGAVALGLTAMANSGIEYNYTYCKTSQIGEYNVYGYGDLDGVNSVWSYNFNITPSGYETTLGFYLLILAILGGLVVLGFSIKEGWFVVIGGMGFMILGIYSIINGIAGFKDTYLTWAMSLFILGVGAYIAIKSSIELIGED